MFWLKLSLLFGMCSFYSSWYSFIIEYHIVMVCIFSLHVLQNAIIVICIFDVFFMYFRISFYMCYKSHKFSFLLFLLFFCPYQWVFVAELMYGCKKLTWHNTCWDSLVILIIKPTRCTISQIYFDKELYMFRTDLLSIIRSLNTVYAAIGICHASSVDCYQNKFEK